MANQKYKPIQVLLLYRPSSTGKLANEETEDFERLGSFSFLLALFFFFHKKKKKAVTYDPSLGRFLQADSVVMPNESFGMNRYMYVSGSPVNYADPSGHTKDYASTVQKLGVLFMVATTFSNPNYEGSKTGYGKEADFFAAFLLGASLNKYGKYSVDEGIKDMTRGFNRGAHDLKSIADKVGVTKRVESTMTAFNNGAQSTILWASGGLARAGDTVNLFTYGRNHNKNSISHKLARSDIGKTISRNKACIKLGLDILSFFIPGLEENGIALAIRTMDDFEDAVQIAQAAKTARTYAQVKNGLSVAGQAADLRCDLKFE
jgi:hypothetical protein